jgi:hypothetical protein
MINFDDAIAELSKDTITITDDSPTTLTMGNDYDPVKKPQHYGQGTIECIKYIEDFLTDEELIGYYRGNIAKYLHRWRYKNGVQDLEKAQWYLDALVQLQKRK